MNDRDKTKEELVQELQGLKLRQEAEEILKKNAKKTTKSFSEPDALKLIHELEVHQIELELQNKELIEAKTAAQIATEKYAELYDFALFGFFTLSKEGEIIALNLNGAKMLGKNRSELLNSRFALYISDDSKPIFNSFCETIISSKEKESCDVEILNNGGSPTYLHLSGIISDNDAQIFVMALDITSRKHTEIELTKAKEKAEENELKFRALYENAPLPYQSLNEDGSFKDVNPAWLSTLGYTREEVIGKFYKDFLHPDWQGHFEKNFPAFKKRGYVSDVHFKIRHKKGHFIDISFEGCIGYHPDGSFKQTYCVFQDITYKKQIENTLIDAKENAEESETKFRELFSNINDALFIFNPDTFEILEANEATSEIYGYSYDELIGMSCLKFSAELEKSKSVAKLIKNEKKVNVKLRHHKKKDGTDVFVELNTHNISVNGKNIFYSVCHDITDIKKTEQELLKNQYYLIKAQEMGNIGTWEIDLLSNRLVWTDETYKIFGIPTGTPMTYELFLNCIHPEDRDNVTERWNEALKNKSYDIEHRILVQGEIKWLREKSEFEYDSEGNAIRAIGFAQDITNRKNSEQELITAKEKAEESEDRYKIITQNTLDIVFMLDKTGKQLFFNESVEKILGYKKEELIGKSFARFVPKSELPKYLLQLKNVFLNKEIQNFISKVYHKNGSLVEVEINGKLVKHDGKLVAIGTIRDMSVRRKDELIIKQKNEELSKINAEKDKFFSIIAHDLKGPLGTMVGLSEYLVQYIKEKNHEKTEKIANMMLKSSNRTMALLSNLMDWAQSQSGRMDYNPEYFEIDPLVQEAKRLLEGVAEQKSIVINNTIKTNNQVFADKEMISTVLRNLIANAIKFTNTGGKITILAEKKENILTMSINDDGVGISEDNVNKLFQITENQSTSGTENEKGTGLGLILCKEFIEKNNGKIWVKSKVGAGSSFYFSLPTTNETNGL